MPTNLRLKELFSENTAQKITTDPIIFNKEEQDQIVYFIFKNLTKGIIRLHKTRNDIYLHENHGEFSDKNFISIQKNQDFALGYFKSNDRLHAASLPFDVLTEKTNQLLGNSIVLESVATFIRYTGVKYSDRSYAKFGLGRDIMEASQNSTQFHHSYDLKTIPNYWVSMSMINFLDKLDNKIQAFTITLNEKWSEENKVIFERDFKNKIYIQMPYDIGLASYHLEKIDWMYINWSDFNKKRQTFDDGRTIMPERIYFTRTYFDQAGFFHGLIDFSGYGTSSKFNVYEYCFRMNPDGSGFLEGYCRAFSTKEYVKVRIHKYGELSDRGILCYREE